MGSIAVIVEPKAPDKTGDYITEILLTEGINGFDVIDQAEITEELLRRYTLAITSSTVSSLSLPVISAYVRHGGSLLSLRPPKDWESIFGLERLPGSIYTRCKDGYLHLNTRNAAFANFDDKTLQVRGVTDLYTLKGAEAIAYISSIPTYPTQYPAISLNRYGEGLAACYAFDLAQCVVRLHQGNREKAGGDNLDYNADGKLTPSDLFTGELDYSFRLIPQADVHQDILTALIEKMHRNIPLPRVWHFPNGAPAAVLINGDSDGTTAEQLEMSIKIAEQNGYRYTGYLMREHVDMLDKETIDDYIGRGHCFGPHLITQTMASGSDFEDALTDNASAIERKYGDAPVAHRSHGCIFPGYVSSAKTLLKHGIRMDTNYLGMSGIGTSFINGSALPVKFADENGSVIDVYELSTQISDDSFSPKLLVEQRSTEQAMELGFDLIRRCLKYNGVYHPSFHPITVANKPEVANWMDKDCKACRELGLISLTSRQCIEFEDARRAITIQAERSDRTGIYIYNLQSRNKVRDVCIVIPTDAHAIGKVEARIGDRPINASIMYVNNKPKIAVCMSFNENECKTLSLLYN